MTVRRIDSPFYDMRPGGTAIDTVIIHSMCAPGAENPCAPEACAALLERCRVSAHYLVERGGGLVQLVAEEQRAWHAGVSEMPDGRTAVNEFSIGIELLARECDPFTDAQYAALAALIAGIAARHPIRYVLGHEHVARPAGRKVDPGGQFDWSRLKREVSAGGVSGLLYPGGA